MSTAVIRQFARSDRDQLTTLVNAHLSAVTPGSSVSVQALLSQLEREPGEFIVDRWVSERLTLVAEQRQRIVAAAHLLRYADQTDVGEDYRGAAEIRWLLCWPRAPFWPDAEEAGRELLAQCVAQQERWGARHQYADGSLPGPGVYGVPEQWPHVRALYADAGFVGGRTEHVLMTSVDRLLALPRPELDLRCVRTLGINGTRFRAYDGDAQVGYIEVDTNLGEAGRFTRGAGLADIGNLEVEESHRRRGVGTWLLGRAADWLALGGVGGLLTYLSDADSDALAAFWSATGFQHLTTTRRGLERSPHPS